ncbi:MULTISPECIES: hypothetical protein [Lysinibacillus]|uniref:hypothetical protein n=1 Tax=Lysinibacillus TaxID=400634 RepID=UPI0021A5AB58|nr:hypothetical protein [Lysinibacillus capsici]MCT1538164.1 hypothetical protein [Lysinibacillus capsici]MCT1570056.1 hypothetical protein [Lysinibacillus capsici]MCT1646826.1 hypothetical protein [Lysinibacillus capsici]MCT1724502.1 hypothetical protein [Lysinibacillus capsici]MCT1782472.1 hypothetical protein [Lysinibacillus capsici]
MNRNAKIADKVFKVVDKPLKIMDNLEDGRLLFLLEMYCYDKVEEEDNAGG